MREQGLVPYDNVLSIILVSLLANGDDDCCDKGETVMEMIGFMEMQGIKLNVIHYGALFKRLSEKGQIETILELYETKMMKNIKPNAIVFTIVISACTKHKKWKEGNQIIKDTKKSGGEISIELATSIINFYAEFNPKLAIEYFQSLPLNVVNERTIAGVLEACCKLSDYKEALKIFNNYQRSFEPNSFIVTPLVKVLLETGRIKEATEILRRFKHILDVKGFTILMKASVDCNCIQFGVMIDEVVRLQGLKRDSIYESSLVSLYFKMGEFVKIEEFIKKRRDNLPLEVWNSIISGYASYNDYSKVDEILSFLLARFEPTMVTLLPILNMFAENGRFDKIQHIIDIMKEFDISFDSSFNNCILKCYLQQGIVKGTNFFDTMEKDEVSYLIILIFALIMDY